jgi:PAS domain S-box-containing protein
MKKDSRSYHILVIEDNPGDFMLIQEYLEDNIIAPDLKHVQSYKEAFNALTDPNAKPFDVILLDLTLPDRSGEALIHEIMAIGMRTPVIVLTGYTDFEFSIRSMSMGISDYILKDDLNSFSLYKAIIYNIERYRTLANLEESEKRYSDLFHLSPLPMWVYDLETLAFLDVNEAAVKHYGYTQEEFSGMTIRDIRPPEDIPIVEDAVKAVRDGTVRTPHQYFRHLKKNGDVIIVEIQGNVIDYKGKKAEVVLAVDVTDNFVYINAIENQNQKLREISWIQSHVVRAPIARLMGLSELIMEKDNSPDQVNTLLGHVVDSAKELDVIIRDISMKAYEANQKIRTDIDVSKFNDLIQNSSSTNQP